MIPPKVFINYITIFLICKEKTADRSVAVRYAAGIIIREMLINVSERQ